MMKTAVDFGFGPPNFRVSTCIKVYPQVLTNIAIENGPVDIMSFPMKYGDFPQLCNRLPEANIPVLPTSRHY